jgi:hypothetical protein
METKKSTPTSSKKSILVCVILLTTISSAFSQTPTLLFAPGTELGVIASFAGVSVLALYMFAAFIKHRNGEVKRGKHQSNAPQLPKKASNLSHIKY